MSRVLGYLIVITFVLVSTSCRDNRSELEKSLYPDGTPPGVTFVEATSNEENNSFRPAPPAILEFSDFDFERKDACNTEHDPYTNDVMTLTRSNDHLNLQIYTSVNCASVAAYPVVSFLNDLVTVSVMEYSLTTGATATAAACNCTNALYFKFKHDVPTGTRVVFLNEGKVTAEGKAP